MLIRGAAIKTMVFGTPFALVFNYLLVGSMMDIVLILTINFRKIVQEIVLTLVRVLGLFEVLTTIASLKVSGSFLIIILWDEKLLCVT